MLPLVDRPLIQHGYQEARDSGIEQFIFITGDRKGSIQEHFEPDIELERALEQVGNDVALTAIRDYLPDESNISFVIQDEPRGLGHAVLCAHKLSEGEPVAVLLPDDIFQSEIPCLRQLLEVHAELGGNVIAVEEIRPDQASRYGIIDPGEGATDTVIPVSGLVEKPNAADAPSNLAIAGRYILEPEIFDALSKTGVGSGSEIQLTDAMAQLIGHMPFHAVKFEGTRFDCGSIPGYLQANVAFGLSHPTFGAEFRSALRIIIGD
jgi:UTP--glucose-1-phosphate uridylyltransferase